MKCLLCGKDYSLEGNMIEVLFREDPICMNCRKGWKKNKNYRHISKYKVKSSWAYNDAFRTCLLQYKESCDEALKDVFLYPVKKELKRYFHGYTLLLLPSSKTKVEYRGFSHLKEMYSCLGLKMIEPFEQIEDRSQKGMSKQERSLMKKNIRLKEGIVLPKKIVLVDDVLTTGSTLKGALSCIDENTHKIKIYTIASTRILE